MDVIDFPGNSLLRVNNRSTQLEVDTPHELNGTGDILSYNVRTEENFQTDTYLASGEPLALSQNVYRPDGFAPDSIVANGSLGQNNDFILI